MADLLEVSWSQLYYITSRRRDKYRYRVFSIPKKSGDVRTIQVPHRTVRILQSKLLRVLEQVYRAHPAAHGFVATRGIRTNADPHVGKRLVLNLDLKDFFPSITFPRVRGMFIKRFGIDPRAATVLARICCNTGDNPDHLPQGSPVSPFISNIVCNSLDHAFVSLAKKHGLFYTRYADDITLSTNRSSFPISVVSVLDGQVTDLGSEVREILRDQKFEVNDNMMRKVLRCKKRSFI